MTREWSMRTGKLIDLDNPEETMNKQLVYSKDIPEDNLFVGLRYVTLVISGRIYRQSRKFLWWKLRPKYTYRISVPYIRNPYFDGEYSTNTILQTKAEGLKQAILDKILELEKESK